MTVRQALLCCAGVLILGAVLFLVGLAIGGRPANPEPTCGGTVMAPGQRCMSRNESQRGTYEELRLRAGEDAREANALAPYFEAVGLLLVGVGVLGGGSVVVWARRQPEEY